MFGTYFYHQRLRTSVAIFGTLFNNIYILRKDGSDNVVNQQKVPLAYAPKSKYLDRIRENPDLINDTKVAIKLPRMSFEIISIQYDPTRQLKKTNQFQQPGTSIASRNKFFNGVPYNIGFQLNIYAKTQDDALQIVEQILPYFNPQYTLSVKPFSDYPNVKEDVPISLTGVDFSDDYESALEARRTIIYTLSFEMRINFYGPILETGVIKTAINNLYDMNKDNQQVAKLTTTPDPANSTADSDYGFNEVWDEEAPF